MLPLDPRAGRGGRDDVPLIDATSGIARSVRLPDSHIRAAPPPHPFVEPPPLSFFFRWWGARSAMPVRPPLLNSEPCWQVSLARKLFSSLLELARLPLATWISNVVTGLSFHPRSLRQPFPAARTQPQLLPCRWPALRPFGPITVQPTMVPRVQAIAKPFGG